MGDQFCVAVADGVFWGELILKKVAGGVGELIFKKLAGGVFWRVFRRVWRIFLRIEVFYNDSIGGLPS